MRERFLLIAAVGLALPYLYLVIVFVIKGRHEIKKLWWIMLILIVYFPTCLMPFLEVIGIIFLSYWWYIGDFKIDALFRSLSLKQQPIPQGLKYLIIISVLWFGLVSTWILLDWWLPFGLS
jgi:hypothetical protein